ncbi:MAG TPA: redoxin domain-containing protein [Thermoleophilaceae bacterium]
MEDSPWHVAYQLPEQAPDFTLEHVLGHHVSLSQYRGRWVVVLFGGTRSAGQLKDGIMTIRSRFGPDQVTVITVSDLRQAPRPARRVVKGKLKKQYDEAVGQAAALPNAGPDPASDILMLIDWSGEVIDQYGLNVDDEAVAIAINDQGQIVGSGSGAQLGEQIIAIWS